MHASIKVSRQKLTPVSGQPGAMYVYNEQAQQPISVKEYEMLSQNPKLRRPNGASEEQFWRFALKADARYATDIPMSLTNGATWDLSNLGTILDRLKVRGEAVEGVTTPYLYIGMWSSIFGYHVEDMNLYSISYLHFGAPKIWYVVASQFKEKMDAIIDAMLPDEEFCAAPSNHKAVVISPEALAKHGIPVQKVGFFIFYFFIYFLF